MRIATALLLSILILPTADACQVQTNAAQVVTGQKEIARTRREIARLGRKADHIFVGSVKEWSASSARFADIVPLKGAVPEGVLVDWAHLVEAEEPLEISCGGSEPVEGQVPELLTNPDGSAIDYHAYKLSYLVYADGQRLLRAVPLDGQAHREIEWLRQAGRIRLK